MSLRAQPCSIELSPDRVRVRLPGHVMTVDVPATIALRYDGKKRRAEVATFGDDVEEMRASPLLDTVGRIVSEAAWYPVREGAAPTKAQAAAQDGEIVVLWPLREGFEPLALDALLRGAVGSALFYNASTLDWLTTQGFRQLGPCDVCWTTPPLSATENDRLVRVLRELGRLRVAGLRLNGEPLAIRGEPRRLKDLPRDERTRLAVVALSLSAWLWMQRGWRHHPSNTWEMVVGLCVFVVALEVHHVARWLRS